MDDLKGMEYLTKKLRLHSPRVLTRYKEYEMKKEDRDFGITIPPQLKQQYRAVLGWCAKAVDTLADRLIVRGFRGDDFNISEIYGLNSADILFDSAILSALIGSCSFIYISEGLDGMPRLQVIEGSNATGVIDPITGLLKEGYAVLKRDDKGQSEIEAYFEPFTTWIISGKDKTRIDHNVPYPLLVPIIHRPDAVRPFGRSRISRSAEYYQSYAKRTLERSDVTAEFYSFPQKYILGLSSDAEAWDTWRATVSSMLRIDKDSDGDKPSVGQFSAASMSPFMEQFRLAAAGFAGETGLTLDDLGFVSDNPTSAEAIKASHETLRLMARKAQRCFSVGFINAGMLASCLRDNFPYERESFRGVEVLWEPVFEADASSLSLIGDGAIKINQAIPEFFTAETLRDLTGIRGAK